MKIIHTSDWHLREKDIEECKKCLGFLVDTARTEAVDLVVVAGDVFDLMVTDKLDSQSTKLAIHVFSDLANICPVAVVIGTPSHDGMAPVILERVRGLFPVLVADRPMQAYLSPDGFATEEDNKDYGLSVDAIITLIPQPTKQYFQTSSGIADSDREIGQAMSALFAGFGAQASAYNAPHILGGHWDVSGAHLPSGQVRTGMDIEIAIDQMMLANPDLICLGHIHIAQRIGDRGFFSGPIYATKIDETGPNGFWIHEIEPGYDKDEMGMTRADVPVVKSRFIETPCKKTIRLSDDFSALENDHRGGMTITECLIAGEAVTIPDVAGTYVRHEIKVWQDEMALVDKGKIRDFYLGAGAIEADIRIIQIPRDKVRSEKVLAAARLRDKLVAMAEAKGETLPDSILVKADMLENMQPEDVLNTITGEKIAERKAA